LPKVERHADGIVFRKAIDSSDLPIAIYSLPGIIQFPHRRCRAGFI
jgi:hypothetical protein